MAKAGKLKVGRGWAWECDFGLCHWAEATRDHLVGSPDKPSPEAKPVAVVLVKRSDWLSLVGKKKARKRA
ncbi:MAG: hypothetical protein ND866_04985 [Pyrinomonadaceae bacterium]|nr:hypothetical protein [Pyrinomonadaceae bacterium]